MKKLFTGNEAVARGAYEAGVKYASAYPGTPSTEILENVALYKDSILPTCKMADCFFMPNFVNWKKYSVLMGKGDIKTKRGKIANKSYGARRPKKAKAKVVVVKKKKKKSKT